MPNKKDKKDTVFYQVSVTIKMTSQTKEFIIQCPDYEEERIINILSEVHPEYETVAIEQIEKPDHIKQWKVDD